MVITLMYVCFTCLYNRSCYLSSFLSFLLCLSLFETIRVGVGARVICVSVCLVLYCNFLIYSVSLVERSSIFLLKRKFKTRIKDRVSVINNLPLWMSHECVVRFCRYFLIKYYSVI